MGEIVGRRGQDPIVMLQYIKINTINDYKYFELLLK